jgi:hypothetical protein
MGTVLKTKHLLALGDLALSTVLKTEHLPSLGDLALSWHVLPADPPRLHATVNSPVSDATGKVPNASIARHRPTTQTTLAVKALRAIAALIIFKTSRGHVQLLRVHVEVAM